MSHIAERKAEAELQFLVTKLAGLFSPRERRRLVGEIIHSSPDAIAADIDALSSSAGDPLLWLTYRIVKGLAESNAAFRSPVGCPPWHFLILYGLIAWFTQVADSEGKTTRNATTLPTRGLQDVMVGAQLCTRDDFARFLKVSEAGGIKDTTWVMADTLTPQELLRIAEQILAMLPADDDFRGAGPAY